MMNAIQQFIFVLVTSVLVTSEETTTTKTTTPSLLQPFRSSFVSPDYAGCVTLYKRGRAEGCGTMSRTVQSGVIVPFDSSSSNNNYGDDDYVVLLQESLLTMESIESILGQTNTRQGRLQGILVTNETLSSSVATNPSAVNPMGKKTPSQAMMYGNDYPWNPKGQKLVHLDFQGTPMVYLRDYDVGQSLWQQVSSSSGGGGGGPVVKASFNYYMGSPEAEMDSIKCLTWKDEADDVWRPKCLPLGGHSVWSRVGKQTSSTTQGRRRRKLEEENENQKPLLLVTARMDAMSLFHDLDFGANQAASNILAVVLAAKMVGQVSDLSGLSSEIVFSLFQGESFGYLGSRRFLLDVLGFECQSDPVVAAAVKKNSNTDSSSQQQQQACLYPLRPSLEFTTLNGQNIAGMLVVDQIGQLVEQKNFYVHADKTDFGGVLSEILVGLSDDDYTISESYIESDDDEYPLDDDDVTLPPTPLTSLLSITGGATGGAVLAGYDNAFVTSYGSRHDNAESMDYNAIAAAATTLARATLAAAYGNDDSDTAIAYALEQIPNALEADDSFLLELGSCLTIQANCPLLKQYATVEASTEAARTGLPIGVGPYLGRSDATEGMERTEANYYVSVFSGQPFCKVGNSYYGAYTGDAYGKDNTDAVSEQPTLLEQALRGMMNDFLAFEKTEKSCKTTSDCHGVSCEENSGTAFCTGGHVCLCGGPVAHYHLALDEGLEATPDRKGTGYFDIISSSQNNDDNNDGSSSSSTTNSALYTEPYWDSHVGVQIYIDSYTKVAQYVTLGLGLVTLLVSYGGARQMRKWLTREKLF